MTEYLDRYPTMHEYAEGKRINPKLTDLISRADVLEAVCKAECGLDYNKEKDYCTCTPIELIKALPSADVRVYEDADSERR